MENKLIDQVSAPDYKSMLKLIIDKEVNIWIIKQCRVASAYNRKIVGKERELTDDEFDRLKGVILEWTENKS